VNKDYSKRGMAFICFESEEGLKACLDDPVNKDTVQSFKPRELKDAAIKMVNNLYFKNVPINMPDNEIKALFEPFGKIKSCIT
jgi:RNA recognition motif-containing protein